VASVNLDKVGAYASAICAVHCVLTGLALGLLSVLGLGFIGSPGAELGFVTVAVIVGIGAGIHGFRQHRSLIPLSLFAVGISALAASHFLFGHPANGHAPSVGGAMLSATAGLCLVTFHVVNQRMISSSRCDRN